MNITWLDRSVQQTKEGATTAGLGRRRGSRVDWVRKWGCSSSDLGTSDGQSISIVVELGALAPGVLIAPSLHLYQAIPCVVPYRGHYSRSYTIHTYLLTTIFTYMTSL